MNLNLLRSFVAVAEEGSLSAAGRRLNSSQPTVGRHIVELEEQLGLQLFERHRRGFTLTARGGRLYTSARAACDSADQLIRQASGLSDDLTGTVRISASQVVSQFIIPPIFARLRSTHPEIALELVSANQVSNLLRRDADIAIRMFRPTQLDVISKHVANAEVGLYASDDYLNRVGTEFTDGPEQVLNAASHHTILGLDRDTFHLQWMERLGATVTREDFQVRCDDQPFHVHATVAGVGIGAIQRVIARRYPNLRPLWPELPVPPLPIWLVAHADLRRSPRIRAVYDALAEGLATIYAG